MTSVFNKSIEIQLAYVNITGIPRIFPSILALMPSRAITTSPDTPQIQSCCFFQYEAILLQTAVSLYLHLHH